MNPFEQWQMAAILLPACALVAPIFARHLTWPVSLFIGYMGASWVLNGYKYHGLEHLIYVSAGLLIGHSVVKYRLNLAFFLSYFAAFQAVFGLCEWMGWNIWNYQNAWELHKPTGFFGQETQLGAFLAACLAPALFSRRWWCAAPILACVVTSHSSFSVAAASAVCLLWFVERGGRIIVPGGAAVLIIVAILALWPGMEWINGQQRIIFWRLGLAKFLESPLFGIGPGGWLQTNTIIWANARVASLHNEWLEMLVEYGIVGAAIVGCALWGFFRNFRLTWHHALCVSVMVDAIGNFPLHIAPIGALFLSAWLMSVKMEEAWISHGRKISSLSLA